MSLGSALRERVANPTLYRFVTVDTTDSAAPAVLSDHTIDVGAAPYRANTSELFEGALATPGGALVDPSGATVAVGETFAALYVQVKRPDSSATLSAVEASLRVFDLADPLVPPPVVAVPSPAAAGRTGLVQRGSIVWSSHWVNRSDGLVEISLDRVDVTKPAQPVLLPTTNVPGTLLGIDDQGRALLLDYREELLPDISPGQCRPGGLIGGLPAPPWARLLFVKKRGGCLRTHRTFHLVSLAEKTTIVASLAAPESLSLARGVQVSDSRLFTLLPNEAGGTAAYALSFEGGTLHAVTTELPPPEDSRADGAWRLLAIGGRRAIYGRDWASRPKLHLLDATDTQAATFDLVGTLADEPSECGFAGGRLVCALGSSGVQLVPLPPVP